MPMQEIAADHGVLQLVQRPPVEQPRQAEEQPKISPYTGQFKEIMDLIAQDEAKDALDRASSWQGSAPGAPYLQRIAFQLAELWVRVFHASRVPE